MQLRLAGGELELAPVQLLRARRNRLRVAVDLVAPERFAREHLRLAGREHDLARLEVGEPPEALALRRQRNLHALLLNAQLRLACAHRRLALLELDESLEPGSELGFARREGRRRLGDLHLARRDRRLALLDARESLSGDAELRLAPLELGLRLADRSLLGGRARSASQARL